MSLDVHVFDAKATADAELKYGSNGTPYVRFSLALNRANNQAIFPDFKAFGETAEKLAPLVKKGSKVTVSKSRLNIGSFTGQDGVQRKSHEYIIDSTDDVSVWTPDSQGTTANTNTNVPTPTQQPQRTGFRTSTGTAQPGKGIDFAKLNQASRVASQNTNEPMFPDAEGME